MFSWTHRVNELQTNIFKELQADIFLKHIVISEDCKIPVKLKLGSTFDEKIIFKSYQPITLRKQLLSPRKLLQVLPPSACKSTQCLLEMNLLSSPVTLLCNTIIQWSSMEHSEKSHCFDQHRLLIKEAIKKDREEAYFSWCTHFAKHKHKHSCL